jgi:hypothetical protein
VENEPIEGETGADEDLVCDKTGFDGGISAFGAAGSVVSVQAAGGATSTAGASVLAVGNAGTG